MMFKKRAHDKIPEWIWWASAAFLVMQYTICMNVFPMGDDYMYGTFGKNGAFAPVFSYYQTGNGRWLINILDSLLLLADRYLYIVLLPWLLLFLGYLLYRLANLLTGSNKVERFGAALGLLSLIDIQMTCETTYWITGAMNYLIPALLLLCGMIATIELRRNDLGSKQMVLYGSLCVFSCLTMEQYGLMSIGWMLLIWGYDRLNGSRLPKRNILIFFLSAAALATIFFAPGNFIRADSAADKGNSLLIKSIDLLYYDYGSKAGSSFLFLLVALCTLQHYQLRQTILSVLSLIDALILLILFVYGIADCFPGGIQMSAMLISALLTMTIFVPLMIRAFDKSFWILFIALCIIGTGSQIMLLATDLWGFRTSFSWILIIILFILMLMCRENTARELGFFASILCMAVGPYMGILGIIGLVICFWWKRMPASVCAALLLATIIIGLSDEAIGYQKNRDVHLDIILAADSAVEDRGVSQIVLQPYDEPQYGWTSPPFSEFHEKYFRSYYGIPDDVAIQYG